MEEPERRSIVDHFSMIEDPRSHPKKNKYRFTDIVVIALCAIVCGADDWVSVSSYAREKKDWLCTFLDLGDDTPSHDTFGRVFALLDPDQFRERFMDWVASVAKLTDGRVVPIDGKTLRRSHDREAAVSAIHMVSAWCNENRLVLGQVKVDEKSNEITAIPELLDLLDVSGAIVTIDAMGAQKDITRKIRDRGGDYVIGLKDNQPKLHSAVDALFDELGVLQPGADEAAFSFYETEEHSRDRHEVRSYYTTDQLDSLPGVEDWGDLTSVGMVITRVTQNNKTTNELRFYISSLPRDARVFANAARNHWGIENSLHWVLDVAFREDDSRVRTGHGAENLAILRHSALNLIRSDKKTKAGVKNRRLKAGWSNDYLAELVFRR